MSSGVAQSNGQNPLFCQQTIGQKNGQNEEVFTEKIELTKAE